MHSGRRWYLCSAGFDGHREDDMGNLGAGRGRLRMGHQQVVAVAERHCRASRFLPGRRLRPVPLARGRRRPRPGADWRRLKIFLWTNTTSPRCSPQISSSCSPATPTTRTLTSRYAAAAPGAACTALRRHAAFPGHPHHRHAGRPGADPCRPGDHRAAAAGSAAALEMAGRIACKSALVISSGISADGAAELKTIARREGVFCSARTAWACSGPICSSMPAPPARWPSRARWRWCRSPAR